MSSATKASRILAIASSGLHALEDIGALAQTVIGKNSTIEEMMAVLLGIEAAVNAVRSGLDGAMSAEDVDKALASLRQGLAGNDAAADSAIDAKFK